MEQIIPILVAVAFFAYQAYSNYQKEQEKARKRNPGQRPPQQEVEEYQADEHQPMSFPDDNWYEPAPQPQRQTSIPTPQEVAVPSKYDKYAGVVDTDEVRRLRQQGVRRQKTTSQPVKLVEVGATESIDQIDFDLRDAVIKAAILERPYK